MRRSGFVWAINCTFYDLCMDFKIIWHSCCPQGVKVPFETFFLSYVEGQGHTLRSNDKKVIN